MNLVSQDSVERIRGICRDAGASSATFFVFDRRAPSQPVRYLFNLGLSSEINDAYRDSICVQDPFLRAARQRDGHGDDSLQLIDQPEVETLASTRQTQAYWEFMQRRGYCESAAALRHLGDGVLLVLGLLRHQRRDGGERLSAAPVRERTRALFDDAGAALIRLALQAPPRMPELPSPAPLTPREAEVVAALCRGASNKRIAAELNLSELTVENHLRRIYRKHGVHNRTSLICALQRFTAAAPP